MSNSHQGKDTQTKVRFEFIKPENYKPEYVNGVYGGMTPRGDLLCHFFYEYSDVPKEEVVPLDKDGKIILDEITRIPRKKTSPDENIINRYIKVGLIIPAHQVNSIANWMIDKIETSNIVIDKEEGKIQTGE
jgi:hypothetical protein